MALSVVLTLQKITTLIGYRHEETLRQNQNKLTEMAEFSRNDSLYMLDMTKATKIDSSVIRIIAVITILYLPGTFVAVRINRLAKRSPPTHFLIARRLFSVRSL